MEENEKIVLFEKASIPSAVAKLSVPMIFSSLVMVLMLRMVWLSESIDIFLRRLVH